MRPGRPRTGLLVACPTCNKLKWHPLSDIKRGAKYCSRQCYAPARLGRQVIMTDTWRSNISKSHHDVRGAKNANWRGGISNEASKWCSTNWKQLLKWRNQVFARDNERCRRCGSTSALEAHHIIPLANTKETAFLRMNGICLCKPCHIKTDNYGGKKRFEKEFSLGETTLIAVTIPHQFQEYPTVGNYSWTKDGILVIFISDMSNEIYERLVLLHEIVEATLIKRRGIKVEEIDKFDILFEEQRERGEHSADDEPGDDPQAPYRLEHQFATKVEKQMAALLGVDWDKYAAKVMSL